MSNRTVDKRTRSLPTALLPVLAPVLAAVLLLACTSSSLGGCTVRRRVTAVKQWENGWSRGAVFYEIFVRSFADSDGDGKGDLKGLIARLDYLNDGDANTTSDLGVDAIWLMPVFASPSYHGYDTTDYETVNPDYGTNTDFERLCQEAHRRGMRVIVDLVMNHTGSGHPWFVASASSASSPKRGWYVWSPSDLGWRQPWNLYTGADTWHQNPTDGWWFYGVFWAGMPDLNYRNDEVRAEMKRLAKLWLDRGADGFRLDAARHLIENGNGLSQVDQPETHAFWREFSAYVRSVRPDATLVGENWTDTPIIATYYGSTSTVAGGDELPMSFDFPLSDAVIAGIKAGSAGAIAAKLEEVKARYPQGANDAPFLTNHDQVRLATQLGNDAGKLRNAAALLLTMPGTPFIYYGEEVGLANGGSGSDDQLKRTPMPWDASAGGGFTTGTPWFPFAPGRDSANVAAEDGDPASVLSRYRTLIQVRHASTALSKGDIELLSSAGSGGVLAFLRVAGDERVLAVHNLGDAMTTAGPFAFPATGFERLFGDPGAPDAPSGTPSAWRVTLGPRGSGIWRVR